MENKIEIKISAPEIAEALKALAASMNNFKAKALKEEISNLQKFQSPKPEEKYEQLQMELNPLKLEDIREKIAQLAKDGRGAQIRELLNKFGSRNLTEIPEEKYGELLREVEKC